MKQEELIFLISQPRSGSTLLQKIIANHSKIYTRSEPWIMLPFAYTLKEKGMWTNYECSTAHIAIEDFTSSLPNGKNDYVHSMKDFSLDLYGKHLKHSDKNFFLDKTPRYYLIFDELKEIFPKAKFILLLRNPLAVLNSILKTWIQDDYKKFYHYKYDLLFALDRLFHIKNSIETNLHTVYYEDFLKTPIDQTQAILEFLHLNYEEDMLNIQKNNEKMVYGDPENVYKYKSIQQSNDNQWIKSLKNPHHCKFFYEYLHFVTKERYESLGYDYDKHLQLINEHMPSTTPSVSMFDYIDTTDYFQKTEIDFFATQSKVNRSLDFSRVFNKLFEKIKELKNTKEQYLIYGHGTIGKTVYSLMPEKVTGFIDQKSPLISSDIDINKSYHPQNIFNMPYDKIIISVLGREKDIINNLVNNLNIQRNKLIVFDL